MGTQSRRTFLWQSLAGIAGSSVPLGAASPRTQTDEEKEASMELPQPPETLPLNLSGVIPRPTIHGI
jgi:hypothetical protein